ncbi:MAG: hypothetical protein GOV00_02470 [Candidatus Altiarchaeota archaeon]|nr:hypothetical protein [Candidatus Altiarchaeota archaeon]
MTPDGAELDAQREKGYRLLNHIGGGLPEFVDAVRIGKREIARRELISAAYSGETTDFEDAVDDAKLWSRGGDEVIDFKKYEMLLRERKAMGTVGRLKTFNQEVQDTVRAMNHGLYQKNSTYACFVRDLAKDLLIVAGHTELERALNQFEDKYCTLHKA